MPTFQGKDVQLLLRRADFTKLKRTSMAQMDTVGGMATRSGSGVPILLPDRLSMRRRVITLVRAFRFRLLSGFPLL